MVAKDRPPTKAFYFLDRYSDSFKLAERVVVHSYCYEHALSHLLAETATCAVIHYQQTDADFKPLKPHENPTN